MKSSSTRLRRTGAKVNRQTVEVMWRTLHHLWEENPLDFIELVRKARKRRHDIFQNPITLGNLVTLGCVDPRSNFAVHDSFRELIDACVDDKGVRMMLHRPFQGDEAPVDEHVSLTGGAIVTPHIVDFAFDRLLELMTYNYVAFAELIRFVCEGKPASRLFWGTIRTLVHGGYAQVVTYELPVALVASPLLPESVILTRATQKLVVRDVIATVLKHSVMGSGGLSYRLRCPYPTRKQALSEAAT